MESLVSSDIARLVYGYLEEQNCSEAAQRFLETSDNLKECREVARRGRRFYTKIAGRGLSEMLDMFSEVIHLVSLVFTETPKDQLTPVQLFTKVASLVGYSENAISKKVFDATPVISSDLCLLDGTDRNNPCNEVIGTPPGLRTPPSSTKKKSAHPQKSPRDSHKLTQEDIFDLNVLDSLINNTVLHEKIAESINKAKEHDHYKGEDNVIVKAALSNTEADPIFDEVIKEIVSGAPAVNAESSTPDDTEAEVGEESRKSEEERRKEAENEAIRGILSSGEEVRRLSAEGDDNIGLLNTTEQSGAVDDEPTKDTTGTQNVPVIPTLLPAPSPIIIQVVPASTVAGLPQASFLNFHGLMQTQKPDNTSSTATETTTTTTTTTSTSTISHVVLDEPTRYRPILPKPPESEMEEVITPAAFSPLKIPLRRSVRMRGGKRRRGSRRKVLPVRPKLERINKDNYHIDFAIPPAVAAANIKRKRGRPPKNITHEMIKADLLERAKRLSKFGNLNSEEILSQPPEVPRNDDEVSVITIIAPSDEVPSTSNELNQVLKDVLEESSEDDVANNKISEADLNEEINKLCMKDFDLSDESNGTENCGLVIEELFNEDNDERKHIISQDIDATIEGKACVDEEMLVSNGIKDKESEPPESIDENNIPLENVTSPGCPDESQEKQIGDQVPVDSSKVDSQDTNAKAIICAKNASLPNLEDKSPNEADKLNVSQEKSTKKNRSEVIPEITPRISSRILGRKGLSLSSPRKGSHIRALDFKTPDKSSCPRKAVTSPKNVSQVNLSKLRSMRRVSLFKSPQKKKVGSSWDADLRVFCPPVENEPKKTNATSKPKRPYRRKTPSNTRRPKKTIPRKRGTELSKACKDAEKHVLSVIEEETDGKADELLQKIFNDSSSSTSSKQFSQFAIPKSPGPVQKTPAKPLVPGLEQSTLTPTLMTPVTRILKEHSDILENSQMLTPSFIVTPDFAKVDPIYRQRDKRTPSPPPTDKTTSDVVGNSLEETDIIPPVPEENDTLREPSSESSLAETDKSSSLGPISSALKKKTKSKFPRVSMSGKKKKLPKNQSRKESLIEQCLESAKNELFPESTKKKKRASAPKNPKTKKQTKALAKSIELPSIDEIMERYKLNPSDSSSSEETDNAKPVNNCLSKHFDVSSTDSSSSDTLHITDSVSPSINKNAKDSAKPMKSSPNTAAVESKADYQAPKQTTKSSKTPDKNVQKQKSIFFNENLTPLRPLLYDDVSSDSSDEDFFATKFVNSTMLPNISKTPAKQAKRLSTQDKPASSAKEITSVKINVSKKKVPHQSDLEGPNSQEKEQINKKDLKKQTSQEKSPDSKKMLNRNLERGITTEIKTSANEANINSSSNIEKRNSDGPIHSVKTAENTISRKTTTLSNEESQRSSRTDQTKTFNSSSEAHPNKSEINKLSSKQIKDGMNASPLEDNRVYSVRGDAHFSNQRISQVSGKYSPDVIHPYGTKAFEEKRKHDPRREVDTKFAPDGRYHFSERMDRDVYSKYEERRYANSRYNRDTRKGRDHRERKYSPRDRRGYDNRRYGARDNTNHGHYHRNPSSKHLPKGPPERYTRRPPSPRASPPKSPRRRFSPRRSPGRRSPPRSPCRPSSPRRYPAPVSPHRSPSKSPRRRSPRRRSPQRSRRLSPRRHNSPRHSHSPRSYTPPKSPGDSSPRRSPDRHSSPTMHPRTAQEHSPLRCTPPRSAHRLSPPRSPHEHSPPRSPDISSPIHQRCSPPKSPQSPGRPPPPRSPSVCPAPKSPTQLSPRRSPQRHSSPRSLDTPYSPPRNVSPIFSPFQRNSHLARSRRKIEDKSKGYSDNSSHEGSCEAKDKHGTEESLLRTPTLVSGTPHHNAATDPRLNDPRITDPRMAGRSSIYKNLSNKPVVASSEKERSAKRKLSSLEKEDGEISDSDNSCVTFYRKKPKVDLICTNTQSSDVNSSFASVDQVSSEKGKSLLEKVGVDRFLSILHGSP